MAPATMMVVTTAFYNSLLTVINIILLNCPLHLAEWSQPFYDVIIHYQELRIRQINKINFEVSGISIVYIVYHFDTQGQKHALD